MERQVVGFPLSGHESLHVNFVEYCNDVFVVVQAGDSVEIVGVRFSLHDAEDFFTRCLETVWDAQKDLEKKA